MGLLTWIVTAGAALGIGAALKNKGGGAALPAGDPAQVELGLRTVLVGRLTGTDYRAGAGADVLPTVVLLHGEGEDPALAVESLPASRTIRVVTVVGRIADAGARRRYLAPLLAGPQLREALLREADEIGATVVAATQRLPVDGRVVVVGLGSAGAVALAIALRGGMFVRAGLGAGGTLTADWIPAAAPPNPPSLYKLSWGDAEGFDTMALKLAADRGWPSRLDLADVDQAAGTPPPELARKWLGTYWGDLGLAP